MQQYRHSNFSDVFCLNCILVIDDAVKQLVSRSFLKYGVSAVTVAAHNLKKKIKSSLYRFINSLLYRSVVASGGARTRGIAPGQHSSKESSQRRWDVGYTVSDLTCREIKPQTFPIDSNIFNTAL